MRESVPFKALDGLIKRLVRILRDLSTAEKESVLPADASLLARLFVFSEIPAGFYLWLLIAKTNR